MILPSFAQFTGTRGTTEPIKFARGPSVGNYIFRKTVDAKEVGDVTGVKLIRDDIVKNIQVWEWIKVDVKHRIGTTETFTGTFGSVDCDPKCPMSLDVQLNLCAAEFC